MFPSCQSSNYNDTTRLLPIDDQMMSLRYQARISRPGRDMATGYLTKKLVLFLLMRLHNDFLLRSPQCFRCHWSSSDSEKPTRKRCKPASGRKLVRIQAALEVHASSRMRLECGSETSSTYVDLVWMMMGRRVQLGLSSLSLSTNNSDLAIAPPHVT
ncbi:hypothetical protein SCHPADRAFT_107978 [Schizopora paradoxa]|uniref:Uncharacterized protein n=1 Tax=Schizopora paradoxa TaxID=27342 RepID=A0A0H2S323_9AGAM|nr:hypothetical protein SCHPADRAFT_107978 [Schizopora paradoxa]